MSTLDLAKDINLLSGSDPAIRPISHGLSSIETVFNSVTSIIKNQILLDRFEHKEELRIQKEIAAEGGFVENNDEFSGAIPILSEMALAVESMIGVVLEGNKKQSSLFTKAVIASATALAGLYIADQTGVLDVLPNFDKFIPEYFRPEKTTPKEAPDSEYIPSDSSQSPALAPAAPGSSSTQQGGRIPDTNAPSVPGTKAPISGPKQIAKGIITNPIGAAIGIGTAAWKGVQNTVAGVRSTTGVTGSMAEAPKGSKATWMSTVYSEYRRLGLTDEGAKTMVAHINRENNFKDKHLFGVHTDAHNNATNVGMMSWQKDRGAALLKFLRSKGLIDKSGKMIRNQDALRAQVQFSIREINSGRYEKTKRALTDPSLKYSQIEAIVGDDYVRWRRKDPKYRKSGYERQNKGYDEINAIIADNTQANVQQFASTMLDAVPSFGAKSAFIIPVSHPLRVTSNFGKRNIDHGSKNHRGMDIGASTPGRAGDPILAANDGIVKVAENRGGSTGIGVYIDHQNGYETRYMHLQSTNVKAGQRVKQGQMIGRMGKTGTKHVHLHFEILKDGKHVNPSNLIPNKTNKGAKLAEASAQNKKKPKIAVAVPAPSKSSPTIIIQQGQGNSKKSVGPAPGSTDRYRAYFS